MNKKATINKCEFTGEFQHPSGNTYYYHELTLDNGEVGTCGKVEKYPFELTTGNYIEYTIDAKKKIKVVGVASREQDKRHSNTGGNVNNTNKKGFLPYDEYVKVKQQQNGKKPEEFLGYAWSYAKDLVVAGKKMKDVKECTEIAQYIYAEIKNMLKGSESNQTEGSEGEISPNNDGLPF
jgi:hypothetical protein